MLSTNLFGAVFIHILCFIHKFPILKTFFRSAQFNGSSFIFIFVE